MGRDTEWDQIIKELILKLYILKKLIEVLSLKF